MFKKEIKFVLCIIVSALELGNGLLEGGDPKTPMVIKAGVGLVLERDPFLMLGQLRPVLQGTSRGS